MTTHEKIDNNPIPPIRPPDHVEKVDYWQPQGVKGNLAVSFFNLVGLMEDNRTVLKYPSRKDQQPEHLQALRDEAERYIRLGPHENLVAYKGEHEWGILLEYCERGCLFDVIEYSSPPLTTPQKTLITKQILHGLIHLHSQNYIHCDMHVRNVFVTASLDAKIGDLQGQLSSPDTILIEAYSMEASKARHPFAGEDEFTPVTDIFALGTLLYHLWHGHEVFPELNTFDHEELVRERWKTGRYPEDLTPGGIDGVIRKCWGGGYGRVSEVLEDVEEKVEKVGATVP